MHWQGIGIQLRNSNVNVDSRIILSRPRAKRDFKKQHIREITRHVASSDKRTLEEN